MLEREFRPFRNRKLPIVELTGRCPHCTAYAREIDQLYEQVSDLETRLRTTLMCLEETHRELERTRYVAFQAGVVL